MDFQLNTYITLHLTFPKVPDLGLLLITNYCVKNIILCLCVCFLLNHFKMVGAIGIKFGK